MTRTQFLGALRRGLRGLSPAEMDDILADYEAHFVDAVASGRGEAEIAASLGNPSRLAGELRAETRLRNWETSRNPRTFVGAGMALVGLLAFNLLVLLPVLLALLACAVLIAYVLYVVGRAGLDLLMGMLSGGDVLIQALIGLGMICGVIGTASLLALLLDVGLRLLARYARLNYRLLKPSHDA
jgi:uncharacterized membrane protein